MAKEPKMSFLSSLNVVESVPASVTSNVLSPRERFQRTIQLQLEVLKKLANGEAPGTQRIWFLKKDSAIYINVRHGSRPVMHNGKKLVLKADSWEQAAEQVEAIRQATEAGELDEELARVTSVNRKGSTED